MRSFFALNSWYSASFSSCVSASAGGANSVAPPSTPAAAMPNSWSASFRLTSGVDAGASAAADAATSASLRGAMMDLQLWMREKHRRQRLCLYVVDDGDAGETRLKLAIRSCNFARLQNGWDADATLLWMSPSCCRAELSSQTQAKAKLHGAAILLAKSWTTYENSRPAYTST